MSSSRPTKQSSDTGTSSYTSNHLSFDVPSTSESARPPVIRYMSTPAYHSPLRHHKRQASSTRQVKETLNARSEYSNSEDDGTAQHRINQYLIKQEIGRGSFGAVHLAVDQYGQEYAVKEFSKSRLRKRAQSNLLRRPSARRRRQGALAAGSGFNSPLHRHSTSEENNSLDLIKEEIAIMKKLNHPNLVSLIEVLDDPEEDSLYMVMEMCKKGVVMRVGLDERADPYDDEQCRCWFRDMILGIEYLHAQGIIHRDLKPDNCLVTEDDVLKIVDFGVSEMFEKESEMVTAKSAGSPAFMPPELCVPKHGAVDGKAADIWSMGVTLFCLKFGRIPFEKMGMLELFDSIRNDEPDIGADCDPGLRDLLLKLLEKDPEKRIKMEQIREHPWVTKHDIDPLLSAAENVAVLVEPPTDEEVNAAITGNMGHLVTVVRAVKRFKQLVFKKRPEFIPSFLGGTSRIVQPPLSMRPSSLRKTKSEATDERRPIGSVLASEGIHHEIKFSTDKDPTSEHPQETTLTGDQIDALDGNTESKPTGVTDPTAIQGTISSQPHPITHPISIPGLTSSTSPAALGKGHAHDPLKDTLFLGIGSGTANESTASYPDIPDVVVSESPSNVDMDVYEMAYQEEIQRILKQQRGHRPTLYLTRRVEGVKSIRENEAIFDAVRDKVDRAKDAGSAAKSGIAQLVDKARQSAYDSSENEGVIGRGLRGLRDLRDAVNDVKMQREGNNAAL
ncbi:Pkinase-domain-containing protein [Delitschia confertaspora ATCC 74209]|uniref:Pkinase-domain-containing protein n=1 Tax=Delitschia confertaspora ATCC 74209 TaxID=1513339 RepID=A0A9P4MTQ3_9PLEO|nr:Pkinase-domain-containing protein [Delitschia confertaspora ATCC 74209]